MKNQTLKNVVIVGGGTAGWMTAAALSHALADTNIRIELVESDAIGTVGVGEATLPHLRFFNQKLGIDERDFMRETNATFKMGIEFVNWSKIGHAYLHPFGDYGAPLNGIAFHHYWGKLQQKGLFTDISDFSLPIIAAKRNRFQFPSKDHTSLLSTFSYAYHVDAGLYAKYLRRYAEKHGVIRHEGIVEHVKTCEKSGHISAIELDSGVDLSGDLFVDCSGFRGLLIEQTLHTGYHDWSHWLPCDSAIAVGTKNTGETPPYSRATAQEAGWQWRIPLQHRTGNGHVYCSQFMADAQANDILMRNLEGEPLSDPMQLRFNTGKRKKVWNKNCVAIGLSGGFLEPLESTSIYLIQDTIDKLISFFPDQRFDSAPRNEFNRLVDSEYQRIRDFLILHYHATERCDSEFWNYVRTMDVPEALQHKIALFKERGHIAHYRDGLFLEPSWLAVYLGQGIVPNSFHPKTEQIDWQKIKEELSELKNTIAHVADGLQSHDPFLEQYLRGDSETSNITRASYSLYGANR